MERGPKRVLNGKKTESRQILQFGTVWNGRSWPFHIFPAVFLAVPPRFSPVFHDFGQKRKKTGAQKWRNGKGKNAFLSRFFPIPVFSRSLPSTSLVDSCREREWRPRQWRGRSAHCVGCHRGPEKRARGEKMMRHSPIKLHLKLLHEVLRAVALRSVGWT